MPVSYQMSNYMIVGPSFLLCFFFFFFQEGISCSSSWPPTFFVDSLSFQQPTYPSPSPALGFQMCNTVAGSLPWSIGSTSFKSDQVQLMHPFLFSVCSCVIFYRCLPNPGPGGCALRLCSECFVVLAFTGRSLINSGLIVVYGVR